MSAASFYKGIFHNRTTDELDAIARVKRFAEVFRADQEFRGKLRDGALTPRELTSEYGIEIDPQEVLPLWQPDYENRRLTPEEQACWPLVELYVRFVADLRMHRSLNRRQGNMREACPRFHAWRERQIARCAGEIPSSAEFIGHAVVAFELSRGCSKACWFCGVSAATFAGYYDYSESNARTWREVVAAVHALCGDASHTGFCYWATDPSDNPDYTKFIADYHQITGHLPQTTTADPLNNIEQTREIMRLAQLQPCELVRFSVVSLKVLRAIHRVFSARELVAVELLCQNKEALGAMALAGRARDLARRRGADRETETFGRVREEHATIACVSGFLVNMPARIVQLVSPTKASDKWPLGYRIYEERTFHDASDFRQSLLEMIERHMPESPPGDLPVAFRRELQFEPLPGGVDNAFRLTSKWATHESKGPPFMRRLGELVSQGRHRVDALKAVLAAEGVEGPFVSNVLQHLFEQGLLNDDPERLVTLRRAGNSDKRPHAGGV